MGRVYDVDWAREGAVVGAIRGVVNGLRAGTLVRGGAAPAARFEERFDLLQGCEIPITAFTPAMCRLFYELGHAAGPSHPVGLGTFYGTALNLIAAGAADAAGVDGPAVRAVGVDLDAAANRGAAANARRMRLCDPAVRYLTADARLFLADYSGPPIDLLYLDVDDPVTGKALYADLLDAAVPHLTADAVVLAHDARVEKFRPDLDCLRGRLRAHGFAATCDVPIDRAGLLVAVRGRVRERGRGC